MSVTRLSCAGLLLLASSVSCGLDVYGSGAASSGSGEAPVESSASSGGAGNTSSSGAGGSGGAGGAGGSAGGAPLPPFCDPADPALLACFRFDDDTNDESGKGNVVTPINMLLAAGKDGQAADFRAGSQIIIADADHWDVTESTVELWYYQRTYAGTRMGLFDSDGRFGLFVHNQGDLQCTRGGPVAKKTGMPLDTWIHAACVFKEGKLRLYVNGELATETDAPALGDGNGSNTIGSNAPSGDTLDGLIDNVRIWNVARSEGDICKAAGKPDC